MKQNTIQNLNSTTVKANGNTHNQQNADGTTGIQMSGIEVENGEVVEYTSDGTANVYSNRILVPGTNNTIAEYATMISKQKGILEKQYIHKTNNINDILKTISSKDAIQSRNTKERSAQKLTNTTIALRTQLNALDNELQNLFQIQEQLKLQEQEAQQQAQGELDYQDPNNYAQQEQGVPQQSMQSQQPMQPMQPQRDAQQFAKGGIAKFQNGGPANISRSPLPPKIDLKGANLQGTSKVTVAAPKPISALKASATPKTKGGGGGVSAAGIMQGAQFVGNMVNGFLNAGTANDAMNEDVPEQRPLDAPKLNTRYNITQQVQSIKDQESNMHSFIKSNTANSNVANQLMQRSSFKSAENINRLYEQKGNIESGKENQQAMLDYQTANANSQIDLQNQKAVHQQKMWGYQQKVNTTNQIFDSISNIVQSQKTEAAQTMGLRIAAAKVPTGAASKELQTSIDNYSKGNDMSIVQSFGSLFKPTEKQLANKATRQANRAAKRK